MKLKETLKSNKDKFGLILPFDYRKEPFCIIDLSRENKNLQGEIIADPSEFSAYVDELIKFYGAVFAIGKYNEDRKIYDHSDVFSGETRRTVHLGIDLWVKSGTTVASPLDGTVHSFNDNASVGDYGPTIIMEHEIDQLKFFTLYGHLTPDSLAGLYEGRKFGKGEVIARVGNYPENGNWPSHLHFQVIKDMAGRKGDFPGVASVKEREKFLELCPDPNLILNIPGIG